ncbi:SusC/RagA family TonB-linked outer membrane protein [Pedobacter rhizosphaerae]|uniref:TonB-linked outer membrane protein, SusC/RagA family n=1 Tax=Pedobacter rhizosphaerae TaxID=390241 RepID=A0A1H9PT49_9SPHI|nr:TonB-dependent receptor [Pedobacter rhizosphaerae]SER51384.1 TonB-linked outer membrane protein, SusC/RagA family [Pedobacter rhizosphaerae]
MKQKILLTLNGLLLLTLLFCAPSYAQIKKITGKITDKADNGALPGVNVSIKGKPSNVSTNADGFYTIQADPATDILVFSYVGYVRQSIALNGKSTLNVSLISDNAVLDDVIVVGYGVKKKSDVLGSVATITGEELQDIPSPNIAGALRNRIAGVGVSAVSGKPGSSINLNIRNASTSNQGNTIGATSEPLYIIDGISMPNSDAFDNLDPSMIENITILKDASAAIYGASGAKGVVLITTKRGKVGKPSLSYNGYMGVSDAAKVPEMLSPYEHALLLNEGFRIGNEPASVFFSDADLNYIQNLNYKSWYNELWQASLTQRHNLSISGGSDKITFFAGGSYQNENGNYEGLKVDKYTFRSGMNATILPGLKADIAFNVDQNVNMAKNNGTENDADFFRSIITVPGWVPITIDDKPVNFGSVTNPLNLLNSGYYDNRKGFGYRINASLSYQPSFIKGLTAKLQFSQGGNSSRTRLYKAPYDVYNFAKFGNNRALYSNQPDPVNPVQSVVTMANAETRAGQSTGNSYQGFFTLQYAKTFGKHAFDLIAGGEQTVSYAETQQNIWIGQLVPQVDEPWAFDVNKTQQPTRSVNESTKRSFFGRFSYDFDKKYLLEGVARIDASSNFAAGNRWGLSPSIGLGWIVSNENFFKDNIKFINFLKFKVNYGITGDDRVTSRLWQERYAVSTSDGYLFGSNNGIGLNPSVLPNANITWEKKQTFNAGIEATMLDNKLNVGIEVFRNYTYDGFDGGVDKLYPMYAGFKSATVNYREVYNWGTEFTLGYRANIAKDLSLSTSMNFSFGNSVVYREFYNPQELIFNVGEDIITTGLDPRIYSSSNSGLVAIGMLRTQAEVDAFLKANPNYNFKGNIPEVGWLIYEDTNKDGIINESDMAPLYKHPNPFLSTGININLGYKGLSLSTNIAARFGGKVFYDSRAVTSASLTTNVLTIWKDRWTPENPSQGLMPRFDDPSVGVNSTFWAVNGTMIRINNMTLSYKVPEKFAQKIGMGSLRILATGNNLWTIVNPLKYKDPYTSSAYDYPTIRTISLGLSANL